MGSELIEGRRWGQADTIGHDTEHSVVADSVAGCCGARGPCKCCCRLPDGEGARAGHSVCGGKVGAGDNEVRRHWALGCRLLLVAREVIEAFALFLDAELEALDFEARAFHLHVMEVELVASQCEFAAGELDLRGEQFDLEVHLLRDEFVHLDAGNCTVANFAELGLPHFEFAEGEFVLDLGFAHRSCVVLILLFAFALLGMPASRELGTRDVLRLRKKKISKATEPVRIANITSVPMPSDGVAPTVTGVEATSTTSLEMGCPVGGELAV